MKRSAKSVWGRIVSCVVAVLFLSAVFIGITFFKMARSMGMGSAGVADYDKRVVIWERPAGSSPEQKLDTMNAKTSGNVLWHHILFASAIVNDSYIDQEHVIDTFTYLYEIKGGYEAETFEDQPYLIPYLAEDADRAVIVLPGGGFGYKSMDGSTGEGRDVAKTLQEYGISAFVLHYRSNPYEYPIPQLDVQRAVRYLKYHASEFGIDPNRIGLLGFSAGGFEVGAFISQIRGNDCFPADYSPDAIDAMDDEIDSAAMIYPALSFYNNVPMLFSLFDDEEVRIPDTREALLKLVDLKNSVAYAADVPQFIAWGTKDSMVGTAETPAYIEAARKSGISVTEVIAEGQDHGFEQTYYMTDYLNWLQDISKTQENGDNDD